MRRDMDLIRELMLKLEALDMSPGSVVSFTSYDPEIEIEGRSPDEIDAHLQMIFDAGFALGASDGTSQTLDGRWLYRRLTPDGHDFIDTVRDHKTWTKTKEVGQAAGGWTLGVLLDIGKAVAKSAAKDQLAKLGVSL